MDQVSASLAWSSLTQQWAADHEMLQPGMILRPGCLQPAPLWKMPVTLQLEVTVTNSHCGRTYFFVVDFQWSWLGFSNSTSDLWSLDIEKQQIMENGCCLYCVCRNNSSSTASHKSLTVTDPGRTWITWLDFLSFQVGQIPLLLHCCWVQILIFSPLTRIAITINRWPNYRLLVSTWGWAIDATDAIVPYINK